MSDSRGTIATDTLFLQRQALAEPVTVSARARLRIRLDKTSKAGDPLSPLRCNLRCIWCHGDYFGHVAGRRAISNQQMVEAVQRVLGASGSPPAEVSISGQGEPALAGKAELLDLVSRLRGLPEVRRIKMITNGVLLRDLARDLRRAGLDAVTVSLNSLDPKTYQRITGADALDRAVEGVQAAVDAQLETKVNCVYTKLNAHEVRDFLAFSAQNHGVPVKFLDLLDTRPICKSLVAPLAWLTRELASLATSVEEAREPYAHIEYRFAPSPAMAIVKTAGQENDCPNLDCTHRAQCLEGCRASARITQDGYLHPCGIRQDNVVSLWGHLAKDSEIRRALVSAGKLHRLAQQGGHTNGDMAQRRQASSTDFARSGGIGEELRIREGKHG